MKKTTSADNARSRLEHSLQRHVTAWQAGDAAGLAATFHPDVEFKLPDLQFQGRAETEQFLKAKLAEWPARQLYLRRTLIDPSQSVAAAEWICRYAQPGETACQELLGGTILEFGEDGSILRWRTYLDPVRRRSVPNFEAPLPDEGWFSCPDPGPPPTPEMVQQIIHAFAQAWSRHDITQLQAVVHDEICIQPPWDYVNGRAALETAARVYIANYTETVVSPRRFILDPVQPYIGVCEQIFACTNSETGRRGEDHDFAFFEIAQGKLRYWRTYFDTSRSAQVLEKTGGFVSRYPQSGQTSIYPS